MRIYSRSEWGARYRDGYDSASIPAAEIFAHHSVTTQLSPTASFDQEAAQMRILEQIGETNFSAGISYTFCIFPSGRVYEGHTIKRAGAHTIGHNYTGRAICFVGNYEVNHLTEAQMNSAAELMYVGKELGWWKNAAFTGGHRDVYATSCPGQHAYAAIPEMNRRATAPSTGDDELNAEERYALLDLHTMFKNIYTATGKPFSQLFLEVVEVIGAAYTESTSPETGAVVGSGIGDKVKSTDARVAQLIDQLANQGKVVQEINRKLSESK